MRLFACGHGFCLSCIPQIRKRGQCPVCRKHITPDIPIYIDIVESEPDDLRKSLLQKDLRIKDLEAKVERLEHCVRQAERTHDTAIKLTEIATGRLRKEEARYKKVELDNEEKDRQLQKYKAWAEEHKKYGHLMKKKNKALERRHQRCTCTARAMSNIDDSLHIFGFDEPEPSGNRVQITDEDIVMQSEHDPPVPPQHYKPYILSNHFTSDWNLPAPGRGKKPKTGTPFPIKRDGQGHAKGTVRLGSRQK